MILSVGRRYVFIHIPKTGGTSMALALEARAMKDDIMLGDTPKALKRRGRVKGAATAGRLWKHSTLADIDGLVPEDTLSGLFTFTLVRNPWDRVVSYYHWLQVQGFDHPAVALAKTLDFEGFLLHPTTQTALRNSPASSYMTDAQGKERCDAYIRLEHFAEDVAPLEAHLGFGLNLPHENRSERVPYQDAYTPKLKNLVGALCASDIARFGYRFEV